LDFPGSGDAATFYPQGSTPAISAVNIAFRRPIPAADTSGCYGNAPNLDRLDFLPAWDPAESSPPDLLRRMPAIG
jgi:hypothetical protein